MRLFVRPRRSATEVWGRPEERSARGEVAQSELGQRGLGPLSKAGFAQSGTSATG